MRQPEITPNSEFGKKIIETVVSNNIKTVVEIGSGSGNGSTQCFIEALKQNGDGVKLYCFEPQADYYRDLLENTKNYEWIKCYKQSAISYDDLLVKNYHNDFWLSEFNPDPLIKNYELKKSWYNIDLPFFTNDTLSFLPIIKAECVLIDGSEFSGYSEFKQLNKSIKWIFLDDCFQAFKNKQVHHELRKSSEWELYADGDERTGWAMFKLK